MSLATAPLGPRHTVLLVVEEHLLRRRLATNLAGVARVHAIGVGAQAFYRARALSLTWVIAGFGAHRTGAALEFLAWVRTQAPLARRILLVHDVGVVVRTGSPPSPHWTFYAPFPQEELACLLRALVTGPAKRD